MSYRQVGYRVTSPGEVLHSQLLTPVTVYGIRCDFLVKEISNSLPSPLSVPLPTLLPDAYINGQQGGAGVQRSKGGSSECRIERVWRLNGPSPRIR